MKYADEIQRLDQAADKCSFLAQGLNPESEHLTLSPEAVGGFQQILREIRADIKGARSEIARALEKECG